MKDKRREREREREERDPTLERNRFLRLEVTPL
jgi:hypothetical protein